MEARLTTIVGIAIVSNIIEQELVIASKVDILFKKIDS